MNKCLNSVGQCVVYFVLQLANLTNSRECVCVCVGAAEIAINQFKSRIINLPSKLRLDANSPAVVALRQLATQEKRSSGYAKSYEKGVRKNSVKGDATAGEWGEQRENYKPLT